MKKILRNSIIILASALVMMQVGDNFIAKDTHFIEDTSSSQIWGGKSTKKLIGSNKEIACSKIYTQYAEIDNSYVLRFATAVRGDINSITYTRASIKGHDENVKDVPTVYRGIIANNETYFYDGVDLATDESKVGDYYWACYTISYGKESSLIDTPIDLSLSINGEVKASIKKSLQYVIDYKAVEDITLSNVNLYNNELVFDLSKGTTSQNLKATASPVDASEADNITYEIENNEIATVDGKGNITPVSVGKTTLTIKCDKVTKVVTIRIVELDDSSLINDSDQTNFKTVPKEYDIPGWYAENSASKSCPISMTNNTITYSITKALNNPAQIRYLPKANDDSLYIGKYLTAFTVTNNTDSATTLKCNIYGNTSIITQELKLDVNESQSFVFIFNSTKESEFLNIKVTKIGIGTLNLSNIHFIALDD